MKYTTVAAAAGLAGQALAFPAISTEATEALIAKRVGNVPARRQIVQPGFDAKAQYISTSGKYAFVPPGPTDLRGPCPGLNAMANHGYLPHNGVATIQQFIDATTSVFGMGADLAGFLSVYGAVFDGDLLSWSIGGPQPMSLVSPLAGLIGQPQGISGSHNKYEGDVSPVRGDLYVYGNDYLNQPELFNRLYAKQADVSNDESNYDLDLLTAFRVERFQDSISGNKYFFNGPFSGFQVQPAAYTFLFRFMGNKSAEYPEGQVTQEVLKDFYSMTGDYPNFKYTPGWEKIPDNWYTRAVGDEYTIPFFESDLLAAAIAHPQFLDIGGNTGQVNTFTPLDITNLTGGVYNLQTLTEGNNALCFSYQLLTQAAPDLLEGTLLNVDKGTALINQAVGKAASGMGCPQLNDIQQGQFNEAFQKYPGFTQLKKNGKY